MAAIGKIRFNWRGEWVSGTSYLVDDIVSYKGNFYICNTDTSDTTNPRDRLLTDDDDVGIVGTVWTLYSVGGLSGNANRDSDGYSTGNILASPFSHGHLKNSHYRSGTYYFGDIVTYLGTDGIMGSYRVKVASTTNAPTNTTDWDKIAWGGQNYSRNVTTHPDYPRPFPNSGHLIDPATNWPRDELGYAVDNAASYWNSAFINKHLGMSVPPGENNANQENGVASSHTRHYNLTSEAAFGHLDWLDGTLTTTDSSAPRPTQMCISAYGNLVLMDNGEVHCAGYNGHGQKGNGDTSNGYPWGYARCGYAQVNRAAATTSLRGKKAIRIAMTIDTNPATAKSMYALIDNGDSTNTLYSWGYNGYGQLGHGNTTSLYVPTAVTWDAGTNGKIVDVWACGGQFGHVWIYTDTDKMFAAGYDNIGQLGTGAAGNQNTFTLVKDWSGEGGYKKFSVGGGYQYSHCLFISGNGKLWGWGYNGAGALGLGDTTNRTSPTQVGTDTDWQNCWAKGYNSSQSNSYACKGTSRFNNTLYGVGYNGYAQLGDNSQTNRTSFVNCLDSHRNNMTNIIDVRCGGYPSGQVTYVEKYLANVELNQSWYKTQWYFQGVTSSGLGTMYAAIATTYYMNYHASDVPNWDNDATTGNYRCFHSNIRYATDINPYRMGVEPYGYNVWNNCMIFYDRDTGRVYWTGYGFAGNSPADTYIDIASTGGDAPNSNWQMQPLPCN